MAPAGVSHFMAIHLMQIHRTTGKLETGKILRGNILSSQKCMVVPASQDQEGQGKVTTKLLTP